jgi:multicomponent Na+:H+ antiporter subunit D
MLVIAGIMALAVSVYAMGPAARERDKAGFQPLFHSLILGVCGSFSTGDLFNLYVCLVQRDADRLLRPPRARPHP